MSRIRHLARRGLIVDPVRLRATKYVRALPSSWRSSVIDTIQDRRTYPVRAESLMNGIIDLCDDRSPNDIFPQVRRAVPMFPSMWLEAGNFGCHVAHRTELGVHVVDMIAFQPFEDWSAIAPITLASYRYSAAGEWISGSTFAIPLTEEAVDLNPMVVPLCVALCCSAMHRHCLNGKLDFWREVKAPKGLTPLSAPASVWREITLRDSVDQHTGQALRSDDAAERSPVRLHIVRGYWRFKDTPRQRWIHSYERGDGRRGEVVKEFIL